MWRRIKRLYKHWRFECALDRMSQWMSGERIMTAAQCARDDRIIAEYLNSEGDDE